MWQHDLTDVADGATCVSLDMNLVCTRVSFTEPCAVTDPTIQIASILTASQAWSVQICVVSAVVWKAAPDADTLSVPQRAAALYSLHHLTLAFYKGECPEC